MAYLHALCFVHVLPHELKYHYKKYINSHDGIKSTFIKLSGTQLCKSFCALFDTCVNACFFPSEIKLAAIRPIFKRNSNLYKDICRSMKVLTITPRLFDDISSDQLIEYFCGLLCSTLSAYRTGCNCQHVILRLTEY